MSKPHFHRLTTAALLASLLGLVGCEQLGIPTPAVEAAKREAEGKAIGGGCRHAARSVETCYEMNKRADKAAVFAGWREMNDYMRENKIEAVPPQAVAAKGEPKSVEPKGEAKPAVTEPAVEGAEKKPAKGTGKPREPKSQDS